MSATAHYRAGGQRFNLLTPSLQNVGATADDRDDGSGFNDRCFREDTSDFSPEGEAQGFALGGLLYTSETVALSHTRQTVVRRE